MSAYQRRYWNLLKELRVHVHYLHSYAVHSEKRDLVVNFLLAFSSSSSIGAWAIWQKYEMLWAAIIACAQVATAVKPLLPYRKRIKVIPELADRLQRTALKTEQGWYEVAEGILTEQEIHNKLIELKNEAIEAEQSVLKGMSLPLNTKLLSAAENEADIYLQQNYH